jgi:hypothetical protein
VASPRSLWRAGAAAVLAVSVSGCALPPIVTAVSVAADVFSYSETGKSVSDHGLSLVMQQDCALLRVFNGAMCQDYGPDPDTREGALVTLAHLGDPAVDPHVADPMRLPQSLAYLDGSLGLAVASAPISRHDVAAAAFVGTGTQVAGPALEASYGASAKLPLSADGMQYLSAGIGG